MTRRFQSLSNSIPVTPSCLATIICLIVASAALPIAAVAQQAGASETPSAPPVSNVSAADPTAPHQSFHQQCLASLDATVALASNESNSSDYLLKRFAQIEEKCSDLPQLAHNQGVVAGTAGRWPEAIRHFERSLQLDGRASMTHSHLKQIFEHRAAQAYALALNIPPTASAPELHLQRSSDQNADTSTATIQRSELHSIGTLEYELYAWWQALQDTVGLKEHYTDGFAASAIWLSQENFADLEWADMHREIAFTANDAVVIVSDPLHNRTLLLLRLVGTRWKIYQETTL